MAPDRDYAPEALAEILDDDFPVASPEELDALVTKARRAHARDPELTPWECCVGAWEAKFS